MKTYQGLFKPQNPDKYKGNLAQIVYRSSWELKFMSYLDQHPDVIYWQSEELVIPYRSPIDGRIHRYFPDFLVKKREKDGSVKTAIIEIKPKQQTVPPKHPGKVTRKYVTEVYTWGVNEAKWKAARDFCADRKWSFHVFTQDELGIKW
jgi:TnsA endonuclease N terminal